MEYSIVIPLKDEEQNIEPLIEEIREAMLKLDAPWEIIAINDGSTDDTKPILDRLANDDINLRPIHFTENFGQSSAFDAGFKAAKGKWIVTIDGDGQNDPKDIEKLIKHANDADLVCGLRQKREDSLVKRWISKLGNSVRTFFLKDGIADTGCSLKLYKKEALKHIKMYDGLHRFLPALFLIEGFRIKTVHVNHRPRLRGKTKYTLWNRSLNTIYDLLTVSWMKKRHLKYKIEDQ